MLNGGGAADPAPESEKQYTRIHVAAAALVFAILQAVNIVRRLEMNWLRYWQSGQPTTCAATLAMTRNTLEVQSLHSY